MSGVKRWDGSENVSVPEADTFIEEVLAVCKKHGMSISHEDHHGAFEIIAFTDEAAEWLREALWRGPGAP